MRWPEFAVAGDDEPAGIIGRTPEMVELYKTIARVAPSTSAVLVLGERGTGKELVARALHRHSGRRHRAFVIAECRGRTEAELESELFGHVRGALPGAEPETAGRFAAAHGGTIFLNEVAELPPAVQAKLLRALQEHRFRPLGGTTWRAADVRVVAASARPVDRAVAAGEFREDLYYRLKAITLRLPSLRERRDDIPLLADHLVRRAAALAGKTVLGVSDAVLELLRGYDWPGNVRELAQVVEQAVARTASTMIEIDDIPDAVRRAMGASAPGDLIADLPTLDEVKKRYIRHVVEHTGGNISRAAAVLGVERRSLYRMLDRYRIRVRDR